MEDSIKEAAHVWGKYCREASYDEHYNELMRVEPEITKLLNTRQSLKQEPSAPDDFVQIKRGDLETAIRELHRVNEFMDDYHPALDSVLSILENAMKVK